MGGSSTASAPSSPVVPTMARAEIRKRQNRDSARRSREKRKSHLRGVAESVEMQSRRVRELDARVAQLEALVHKAVKHPTTGNNNTNNKQARNNDNGNNENLNGNTAATRRMQQTIPNIPSMGNTTNANTRNNLQHHQQHTNLPHLPHSIPTMPAPTAPFYPGMPGGGAAGIVNGGSNSNLNGGNGVVPVQSTLPPTQPAPFLPTSLLGCIPPVTPTASNNALPMSVSTPFASGHPPQSALAFALDPWSMPSEPLVAGNVSPASAGIAATISSAMLQSTSHHSHSNNHNNTHPIPQHHHATNALDPYMGGV